MIPKNLLVLLVPLVFSTSTHGNLLEFEYHFYNASTGKLDFSFNLNTTKKEALQPINTHQLFPVQCVETFLSDIDFVVVVQQDCVRKLHQEVFGTVPPVTLGPEYKETPAGGKGFGDVTEIEASGTAQVPDMDFSEEGRMMEGSGGATDDTSTNSGAGAIFYDDDFSFDESSGAKLFWDDEDFVSNAAVIEEPFPNVIIN